MFGSDNVMLVTNAQTFLFVYPNDCKKAKIQI